jgi:hypothetical protein
MWRNNNNNNNNNNNVTRSKLSPITPTFEAFARTEKRNTQIFYYEG